MSVQNERAEIVLRLDTTAAAADALAHHRLGLPGTWRIESAYLMPDIAVAAHASNGSTLALQTGANKAGLATRASHNTLTGGDGALSEGVPVSLTPATTVEVDQGELLALSKVDAASGQAFRGSIAVTLLRVA